MELERDWRRQAARAAGATAIAPAVLLTAGVLLATGAGLGGLGSLGQVTGGPSIPPAERADTSSPAPDRSPEVALQTPAPASSGAAAPSRGSGSDRSVNAPRQLAANGNRGAARTSPAGRTPAPATPQTPTSRQPSTPTQQAAPQSGSQGTHSPTPTPVAPTSPIRIPQTPTPPAPNPVNQILDTSRGLGQALPGPVEQLTGRVLDTVNGLIQR